MSDSGGKGDAPPPRKVRTRQPTLIGLPTAKPGDDGPAQAAPAVAKKAFPAPPASGVAPKPAFPFRPGGGGLPSRKRPLPPRKPLAPEPAERATDPEPRPAEPPESAAEGTPEPTDLAAEPTQAAVTLDETGPELPFEELAAEPTQAAAEAGRTLMDDWAPAEIPAEGEGDPPLPAEPTQVSDEPEAIHTDPGLDVPYEGDLASEETRPAAASPEPASPEPEEEPLPERDSVEDMVPVSTVIVDPASMQQPAQVYTMDLESGAVSMQGSTAYDEPIEVPGRKSPVALIVGGLVAAVVIVSAGIGIGYVLMSPSDGDGGAAPVAEAEPATAAEPAETEPIAPTDPSPDPVADPSPAAAPTAEAAPTAGADEGESADEGDATDEGDEDEAPAPATAGAPASIEAIEAYELELPRVSRRARRMPDAERRRVANRLRGRALAAYREERWDDAARDFAAALEHNDWDVASIEGMARTRARQSQFPEAVAWAELAVQRNSRSAATFRVLGDVWRQAGHDDRAVAAWRRGLRRHPGDRWLRQRIREVSGS